MDIVYLCRYGLNEELRYSLRSLINIPHDNVYIVGGVPNWFRGNRIRSPKLRNKHATTNQSMRVACETAEISDPFILFNDDFYITTPTTEPPNYHRGPINGVIRAYQEQNIKSRYVAGMARTAATLEELGLPTLSYELHIPMVIHKQTMLEALTIGGQRRSIYGNLINTPGPQVPDVKVYTAKQPLPAGPYLSSDDTTYRRLKPMLHELFPKPSQYERRR